MLFWRPDLSPLNSERRVGILIHRLDESGISGIKFGGELLFKHGLPIGVARECVVGCHRVPQSVTDIFRSQQVVGGLLGLVLDLLSGDSGRNDLAVFSDLSRFGWFSSRE